MAHHEFGRMTTAPQPGERFDRYNPWDYDDVISADDDDLEPILDKLSKIRMYAHTIDNPCPGLNCCGITLIPPEAAAPFLAVIEPFEALLPLKKLLVKASQHQNYVIHFGL